MRKGAYEELHRAQSFLRKSCPGNQSIEDYPNLDTLLPVLRKTHKERYSGRDVLKVFRRSDRSGPAKHKTGKILMVSQKKAFYLPLRKTTLRFSTCGETGSAEKTGKQRGLESLHCSACLRVSLRERWGDTRRTRKER